MHLNSALPVFIPKASLKYLWKHTKPISIRQHKLAPCCLAKVEAAAGLSRRKQSFYPEIKPGPFIRVPAFIIISILDFTIMITVPKIAQAKPPASTRQDRQ